MATPAQTELHDDAADALPTAVSQQIVKPLEPDDVLDFCSCGKKNCPRFERLTSDKVQITDSDFPGVKILLTREEALKLGAWLRGHFGG